MTGFKIELEKYGFVPMNHEKPNWFPVSIGDVFDNRGQPIAGYKRVQRDDTGDTLALHSDRYRLIPYEDAFRAFDQALLTSGLDLTDMAVATDMSDNGAKVYRQYLLPAYTEEVSANDPVALRIAMFNSYDGSAAFRGLTGFYRFACANESFIGRHIIDVRLKHTGERPIEPVIESIVGAAKAHTDNMKRLRRWSAVNLMAAQVKELVGRMPQATPQMVDKFVAQFASDGLTTLWDLHNVLTAWATHGDVKGGTSNSRARVKHERGVRVLTLVEGEEWRRIERGDEAVRVAA